MVWVPGAGMRVAALGCIGRRTALGTGCTSCIEILHLESLPRRQHDTKDHRVTMSRDDQDRRVRMVCISAPLYIAKHVIQKMQDIFPLTKCIHPIHLLRLFWVCQTAGNLGGPVCRRVWVPIEECKHSELHVADTQSLAQQRQLLWAQCNGISVAECKGIDLQ